MNPAAFLADRAARRIVLKAAESLHDGELAVTFPNGKTRRFGRPGSEPRATLRIHDDAFFRRVLLGGEIGFGEAFVDGLWDTDDLPGLLVFGIGARQRLQFNASWMSAFSRLKDLRWHRNNRNTKLRARDNIHAHYDIGNAFFRLWLDDTMTYSCAYFDHPDQPLADAQRNKYRMLCEKAQIGPGDHVLEIGCGWGGFAMFAAEHYGCRVTGLTISYEQLALARERVAEAGLSSLVDIQFCDYRDITGEYDRVLSIEMFEAVGAEYFESFFHACDRALRPGGRMVLQTISVPDRSFAALRDGVNWMQKYIFPGGMLPSIAELERSIRDSSLVIDAIEDIGPHYALTLRRWRERFLDQKSLVYGQGFDERFCRMWEYYLAASEAGFTTRNTGDLQVAFDKVGARRPGRETVTQASRAGQTPTLAR